MRDNPKSEARDSNLPGLGRILYAIFLAGSLPFLTGFSLFPPRRSSSPETIPALQPPRAEIPPGFWEQYGWWVVAGGVVLLVLVAVAIWWLCRPKPAVVVPPDAQARQALEPLRRQPETGAVLSLVSRVLRQYVIQAFRLPSGEPTTTEFCRALETAPEVGRELSAALADFLRQCDQRKFAPAETLPPLNAVDQAARFIDQAEARRGQLRDAAAVPLAKPEGEPQSR